MWWSALGECVRPVEPVVVGCGLRAVGGWVVNGLGGVRSTDAVTEALLDVPESRVRYEIVH